MGTTDNMTEKEMTEEIKESRMTVRMTFWDWPLYLWEFSLIPREE